MERYQEIAFRTAYLILRDAAEAEEAAQDGFMSAYRSIGRFQPGRPFRPWILQIVANQARNRRKAIARREAATQRAATQDLVLVAPPPDESVDGAERRQAMLDAVNELRDEDREVISCRYFLDLSEEETAMALGCPRGTVKSRLSRALGRLREVLADQDFLEARAT